MGKNVVIACDFDSKERLEAFLNQMEGATDFYCKIGMELFNTGALKGFNPVEMVKARGHKVFMDLKNYDIPNTLGNTFKVLTRAGVDIINIMAESGSKGMMAARKAIDEVCELEGIAKPILLAVTVLTSKSKSDLEELGIDATPEQQVIRLAKLAKNSGCDGVVCSPEEISAVKEACGKDFVTLTPGIRFADSKTDDQERIATPAYANKMGTEFIVVGRPITQNTNPAEVYNKCKKDFTEPV